VFECWELPNEQQDEDGLGFLGALIGIVTSAIGLIGAAKSGPSKKQLAAQQAEIAKNEQIKKEYVTSLGKIGEAGTLSYNIKYITKKNPEIIAVAGIALAFWLTSGSSK
jgi:hypothetical protein